MATKNRWLARENASCAADHLTKAAEDVRSVQRLLAADRDPEAAVLTIMADLIDTHRDFLRSLAKGEEDNDG